MADTLTPGGTGNLLLGDRASVLRLDAGAGRGPALHHDLLEEILRRNPGRCGVGQHGAGLRVLEIRRLDA